MKRLYTLIDRDKFATVHAPSEGDTEKNALNLDCFYCEAKKHVDKKEKEEKEQLDDYYINLIYSESAKNVHNLSDLFEENMIIVREQIADFVTHQKGAQPYLIMRDEGKRKERIVCQLIPGNKPYWQIMRIEMLTWAELDFFVSTLREIGILDLTKLQKL